MQKSQYAHKYFYLLFPGFAHKYQNLLNGSVLYSPFRKQWDRSFTEVIAYSATMHVLPIILFFAHNFSSVGSNENGMVAMVTIT